MKQQHKKIFIASLSSYVSALNGFQFTASDQLASLFAKSGIAFYKNPQHKNRYVSLCKTLWFLIKNIARIDTAILPLYGTTNSIWWYRILEKILIRTGKRIICVVHGGSIPEQLKNNTNIFLME